MYLYCSCAFVSSSGAATYYVAETGGDDTRSCATAQTHTTARKTVNKGIECLASGDTLEIKGGTYEEYIHNTTSPCSTCKFIPSGTSWATATTITNYNGETVRLKPAVLGGAGFVVRFFSAGPTRQYIIIKGTPANTFIIDGINFNSAGGQDLAFGGVGIYGPSGRIRLDGVLITDTSGPGGLFTSHASALSGAASTGNEFVNGTIRRAGSKHPNGFSSAGGTGFGHCVYITTAGNLLENNLFEDCAGNGVSIYRPAARG